jgi:hypothetical protein
MMTLMAEFTAKSVIEKDGKVLADLKEASVVAVAVEETGTNTRQKNNPASAGLFFIQNIFPLITKNFKISGFDNKKGPRIGDYFPTRRRNSLTT